MLATMGKAGYGTFLFFSAACFLSFLFAWFLYVFPYTIAWVSTSADTKVPNSIPETKGLSLERMDDLFGVTEMAKKMEDEEGAHAIPPAKDFEGEKTQHVEVSQVDSNTKH